MFLKEILILFHYGRAVKCSIIPKSTSLWIKKKTTLQVNTGIYPTQYMAQTNLQQNKQQAKTQQTVQQQKKKIRKITQQNHH